jgi:hypothetical protein
MQISAGFVKLALSILVTASVAICSCRESLSSQPIPAGTVSTEVQAIYIASRYVPADIFNRARISAGAGPYILGDAKGSHMGWDVQFFDISVTKSELGWPNDSKTEFGDEEPYTFLSIKIDYSTGALISRQAYIPTLWGIRPSVPG